MQAAVQSVNASLRLNDPRHTVSCLLTSDLQLPQVFPFAAALYHQELQQLQRRSPQVHTRTHRHHLPLIAPVLCCPLVVKHSWNTSLLLELIAFSSVHQGELQQEDLFVAVEMLSAVALINQALEAGHVGQFGALLVSESAGLADVDPTVLDR